MIVPVGLVGEKVAVLGLARSGISIARALEAGGARVSCWDDDEATRDRAADLGLTIHNPLREIAHQHALFVSPGIPHLYPAPHPLVGAAYDHGVPVDNDIGLFFRSFAGEHWDQFDTMPRIVAVTGSNGKSTTSALLHHIFQSTGRPSQLCGNIGRGVFDLEPPLDGEVIVMELSSYQIELARALTPDIAVFTNLGRDHLERHGGLGGYFAAKRRLFAEGGPDRAIIGVDEVEGRSLAGQLAQGSHDDRVIRISGAQRPEGDGWSVFALKHFLAERRKGRQVASIDLRNFPVLRGRHNYQNACAAFATARALGLGPRPIEEAMRTFEGLPHRCQLVAEIGGIRFINDSKATNVDSALRSLEVFENIRWICGGQKKEGGLEALQSAASNVKKAYVIGTDAQQFASDLAPPTEISTHMDTAVARAFADAEPGDVILLSPAAASFDQFRDFEQRGEAFIAAVQALTPR